MIEEFFCSGCYKNRPNKLKTDRKRGPHHVCQPCVEKADRLYPTTAKQKVKK